MATLLGSLLVSLGLESGEFRSGLSQAEKELRAAEKRFERIGKSMADFGAKMSIAVTLPLVAFGKQAVEAAIGSRDAMAQVEQAITSMGNAAGRTSKQLADLSSDQMHNSLYDDDDILRQVTANLLTFGNVATDVFDRAQQVALDLSARLGQDLKSSALQLGKALNDPIKGVSALQEVGVSFTEQQKDQIKTMVATGKGIDAQRLILSELEKEFGGSAAAMAKANPFAQLKHSIDDFQEAVGGVLLQILPPLTDAIRKLLDGFGNLSPAMQDVIVKGGLIAAAMGPVLVVFGSLTKFLAPALAAFRVIGGYMASTGTIAGALRVAIAALGGAFSALAPVVAIVGAIAAAGYLLYKNWDQVAPVLMEVWDAIEQALGPPTQDLINTLSSLLSELWNGPLGEAVRGVAAVMLGLFATFVKTFGPPLLQIIRVALETLTVFFDSINTGLKAIAALLEGDWQEAWNIATGGATNALDVIRDRVLNLLGPIGMVIKALIRLGKLTPNPTNGKTLQQALGETVSNAFETLTQASAAAAAEKNAQTPTFSVPETKSKKSKSTGKTAQQIADDQAEEIARLGMEEIRAKLDLATSAEDRASLSYDLLAAEKEQRIAEINANKDFSAEQKKAQIAYIERLYGSTKIGADGSINVTPSLYGTQLQRDLAERQTRLANDMLDRQAATLEAWADIEPNTKERARLEAAALELHQQIQRNLLDQEIASGQVADAEQAQVMLAQQQAAARERLRLQNMSPLEKYQYDIQSTTSNMSDALEGIAVSGLQTFNDQLTDAIVNFKSLGDVARSVIRQILSDLIRLQIQKAIIGPLTSFLGGLGGGLSASGIAAANSTVGATIAANPAIFAGGGFVEGPGTATSDSINARLSNGEYVLNAKSVKKLGVGFLDRLNGGMLPGFASGGLYPRQSISMPANDMAAMTPQVHSPTFVFPGITDPMKAREAAGQAARRYRREINGPLRNMS